MAQPVEFWIDRGLEIGRAQAPYILVPGKSTFFAFAALKGLRVGAGLPANVQSFTASEPNLACAEHYMFARWLTSVLPIAAPTLAAFIVAYQLAKIIDPIYSQVMGSHLPGSHWGQKPPTPPSSGQVIWGLRGVMRGSFEAPFMLAPGPGLVLGVAQELAYQARKMGVNSAELRKLEQL